MAKFKGKIFFDVTVTLFALATLILTLFNYNPYTATTNIFVIFYLSFFFSLAGISSLCILFIRSRFSDSQVKEFFWPAVRISLLISAAATLLLALQGLKILDLWVGVPLSLAIIMLELFFRGNKYKRTNEN